jgi:hypothetical protein
MKKSPKHMKPQRKLTVDRETIAELKPRELTQVVGGDGIQSVQYCSTFD